MCPETHGARAGDFFTNNFENESEEGNGTYEGQVEGLGDGLILSTF